jgi:hypothetical protein
MGKSIPPVADHVEGTYKELEFEPIIEKNKKVGERMSGFHEVHYIPFSKSAVDEIIENSHGTYKENIVFIVKDGPFRNDKYSYDQFVNLKWNEAVDLMNIKGGPRAKPYDKTKQAYL